MKIFNKILVQILREKADLLESGNSNLTKEEILEVLESIDQVANKDRHLSKEQACNYLNISRSQFDNYVKDEKIPKGKKQVGFKELSWSKWELDLFKLKSRQ